jgi:Ca2+-binding EF-hand superfamily protein
MAGDLSRADIEKAEFAFSIYDHDGSGKIDAQDIGDVLRALNTNPTLALIEKMGGKKKRGEQLLALEEFLPIYGQVKKEKEQGCYEDFLECLKLYDKNEDGTMLLAELHHTLLALGEVLTDDQVKDVFKDCMGAEDDEGNIKYAPFLQQMMVMAPLLPQ